MRIGFGELHYIFFPLLLIVILWLDEGAWQFPLIRRVKVAVDAVSWWRNVCWWRNNLLGQRTHGLDWRRRIDGGAELWDWNMEDLVYEYGCIITSNKIATKSLLQHHSMISMIEIHSDTDGRTYGFIVWRDFCVPRYLVSSVKVTVQLNRRTDE